MIKRELMKKPELANESWDRFYLNSLKETQKGRKLLRKKKKITILSLLNRNLEKSTWNLKVEITL
jgi:hypothetical protein